MPLLLRAQDAHLLLLLPASAVQRPPCAFELHHEPGTNYSSVKRLVLDLLIVSWWPRISECISLCLGFLICHRLPRVLRDSQKGDPCGSVWHCTQHLHREATNGCPCGSCSQGCQETPISQPRSTSSPKLLALSHVLYLSAAPPRPPFFLLFISIAAFPSKRGEP